MKFFTKDSPMVRSNAILITADMMKLHEVLNFLNLREAVCEFFGIPYSPELFIAPIKEDEVA